MYNKLVLINHDEEFQITFHGIDHIVPSGKFEAEAKLGNFIFSKAKKFGINVAKVGVQEPPKVSKIEPIVTTVEDVKEEEVVVEKEDKKEDKKEEKKFGYKI